MDEVSRWISEIALLMSGFIYVHTIEAREKNHFRLAMDTVLFLAFVWITGRLPFAGEFWAESIIWSCKILLIMHILRSGKKLTVKGAVYYGIWAFISWQMLYEIYIIIEAVMGDGWRHIVISWGVEAGVFFAGYLIVFITIAKWIPDGGQKKIGPRQITAAVLTFLVFEIIALTQRDAALHPEDGRMAILYLSQLLLAVLLYLESELFKKSAMRQELEVMNLLWKKEQEQYRISKENIALINQKCHDLKHQVRAIQSLGGADMKQYLTEIEDSIQIYEAIVKTGNEVLDTILTEKSLFCKEHGITISCMADGGLMKFINTVDLYAILGNAIDNAIEAVEQFRHKEKRQIDILIYRQKEFLVINVVNPIKGSLVYEEELPVTTKKDKDYHGYGLKSVKHLLKKYEGFLSISEEDGCFSLMMLIPVPKST